jgi:cation transporter-like permease
MKKTAAISSVLDVPGLPATPFGETSSSSITVPAGKHLVVETLSVQVDVTPLASQLEAFVNYTCGGNSVQLFVPLTFAYGQTSNQYATYVAMQAVRLYVDPDTVVSVTTFTPTGSTGTLFLTLSGYLI